jgi:hypothetical protein
MANNYPAGVDDNTIEGWYGPDAPEDESDDICGGCQAGDHEQPLGVGDKCLCPCHDGPSEDDLTYYYNHAKS